MDKDDPETWLTLTEVREILQRESPGKWSHNRVFEDVDVAVEAKLMPSDFWAATEQNRAFLLARKRVKGTMEMYESYLHEKELNKQRSKPGKKGKGKS